MNWARKSLVNILWVLLVLSLLGVGLSASANLSLSHPQKVENWLNQSNLYGNFVSNTIAQAERAAGSTATQTSITLGGTAVQEAASSTFTTSLFQKDVSTFLNSNYSWLNGKTSKPNFTINLLSIKQRFAGQVANYVQAHIASLPVCTTEQLLKISANNIDPLNATCRPSSLNAQAEASLVAQNIENSKAFLSTPVLTADNIRNTGSNRQPYYKRFSEAPTIYKLVVKSPWIYAVAVIISALGVIFLAIKKRFGLRRVGVALVLAGAILIATRFIDNLIVKKLDIRVLNKVGDKQVQQAIKNSLKLAVHHLAQTDLWFGAAFLLLAVVIFLLLLLTSHKVKPNTKVQEPPSNTSNGSGIATRFRSDPKNSAPPPKFPIPAGPAGPPPPPPRRKKRPPRLVQ
jgi:hypothetical protein